MPIESVAIVGAGTMGSGIAISLAQNGVPVRLVDVGEEAVARAVDKARRFYARAVEKGRMEESEAAAAVERIAGGTELGLVAGADLVIEAVFERFDVKAELYRALDPVIGDTTILATNTSCLKVGELAQHFRDPARFLGMHYFNPAEINPIVEVVRGAETDPAIFDEVLGFCRRTGKKPIACRDSYGFALNRFFCPYGNEAVRAMEEGLGTPAAIDRAAQRAFGVAAGPFAVMNLVKPRIMLHAQENLAPHGRFYEPAAALRRVGEAGEEWQIGEPSAPDPDAETVIVDRLRGATFLPVLQELDEEVAKPAEIDMGAALALRFGTPPCGLMDGLGRDEVERLVVPLCEKYGAPVPRSLAKVGALLG